MKTRKSVLTLATFFAAAPVSFAAADANMGTWKLNENKSKIAPGGRQNATVVYAAAGPSVKAIVDGVEAKDKPEHFECTGKFDGKNYPVTGDPASGMRSYTRVNARTLEMTEKKDDKIAITGRIAVSADGKSRTVTTTAIGAKTSTIAVYDKQ